MFELETGTRLGRYELLTELGRGGMASVWVAREVSLASNKQRLVALKIMLPELARDPTFRAMFLEEGQIVRSIEHENVAQVYEVAESQGLLYMAMEWVEGDSLRTVIKEAKQRRAIPPEMAVRIIADTAAGLHAAHELRGWDGELRGIVHCDVSPHNILIGPGGTAKLVDFGVAHAASQSELDDGGGAIRGKFGYMSPEQALGRRFDRRSDLFAMGIVLFELTTGERLFRGRDAPHSLKLIASGPIPPPSSVIPSYPDRLEQIVLRCLERDVSKRFQTAEELREALERYLVNARVMVSHAGVGKLVNRVIGARIQKRRAAIRAALKALGDGAREADAPLSEVSASMPSATFDSGVTGSGPLAEYTGAAVPSRRWGAYVAAALLLLAASAAAGLIVLAKPGLASNGVIETGVEPSRRSSPVVSTSQRRGAPEGASIDSLPSEQLPLTRPFPRSHKRRNEQDSAAKAEGNTAPRGEARSVAAQASAPPPAQAGSSDPTVPGFEPVQVPAVPAPTIAPVPEDPEFVPRPGAPSRASGRAG